MLARATEYRLSPIAIAATLLIVALASRGAAQSGATPAQPRSTSSGVFTAEQADRGEKLFSVNCTGCHSTSNYTESAFRTSWNGRPLSELYSLMSETMPEDFPGGLLPQEYADLVAFLLELNRAPAGAVELPPDAAALAKIRIEIGRRD